MKGNCCARRGVAAAEAAIVLSVFLVILFGMLDLGLMVLQYSVLSESARHLGRVGIVHGSMASPKQTTWGPTTLTGNAGDGSEYANTIQADLVTFQPSEVAYKIEWLDGTNQPDDRLRVTLTYQYRPLMPFVFGNSKIPFEAVTTMLIGH